MRSLHKISMTIKTSTNDSVTEKWDIFEGIGELDEENPPQYPYPPKVTVPVPPNEMPQLQEDRRTCSRCAIFCYVCLGVVVFLIIVGVIGAAVGLTDEDTPSTDPTTPTNSTSDCWIDESCTTTTSSTASSPTIPLPPVIPQVVNFTAAVYVYGSGALILESNKLSWESQADFSVPALIDCEELDSKDDLCSRQIDLGSEPELLSVSRRDKSTDFIDQYPSSDNNYRTYLPIQEAGDQWNRRWFTFDLSYMSGGHSFCNEDDETLSPTYVSTSDGSANTTILVRTFLNGNSDNILIFRDNRMRWFSVKGTKPEGTVIDCATWNPNWDNTPNWCQACTHPSGELDLCTLGVSTTNKLLNVKQLAPRGSNSVVSWRNTSNATDDDEWIMRGGPQIGEWAVRIATPQNNGEWTRLLLTFRGTDDSTCENRPAQSCTDIFDASLVCREAETECKFLAGGPAWPEDTCGVWCELKGGRCIGTYPRFYGCETYSFDESCDRRVDEYICKCTRPQI